VNTRTVCFVALLFGFAVAVFGSDAGAQTEVKAKDRDAAIEKCIARAHREYPDPGEAEGIRIFRARAASYKACMAVACKCASVDDRVLAVRCSTHLMTVG